MMEGKRKQANYEEKEEIQRLKKKTLHKGCSDMYQGMRRHRDKWLLWSLNYRESFT